MPGFGTSLENDQIKDLVAFIHGIMPKEYNNGERRSDSSSGLGSFAVPPVTPALRAASGPE